MLSRKASNHSLRIPSSDALAEIEAADAQASGREGGPHSEDLEALSLNDRQLTAVIPGAFPAVASIPTNNNDSSDSEEVDHARSRMMISEETAAIPITSANGYANSFSQAATPMNDTFLSTLAPMPIHQRLDLAENGSSVGHGSGSGVPETLEEESDSVMDMEREIEERRRGSGSGTGTDEGVFELNGP